jgi:sucrose phosphorylase
MRNEVQLITYADRLGGTLGGLGDLLRGPLAGLFGGVHVLPFFRPYDGADAGFDPADHTSVDARLGDWDDVRALRRDHDVLADLIVNHVSSESDQFRDVLARGTASPYADMFLTLGSVFPNGATEAELLSIFRPRPGLPFTRMRLGDADHFVWTTFTNRQIDIDVHSASGAAYLESVLSALAGGGVTTIRLDAVGYAVKTPGTTCFMTPDTYLFVDDVTKRARALGVDVLVEVHGSHEMQLEVARHVDWVYDFALPPLILHALLAADAAPLRHWFEIRPSNAVTVLDTHDGIGIVDVAGSPGEAGLLGASEIDDLVEAIHDNAGGTSRHATGAAASNLDLYQVNCTYYDALGRDDRRYLLARMLQFFTPGVPQVYYVGLLAGSNDMDLLARTGVGRDVNRHHYLPDEITTALQRPIVQQLMALIRFRNTHPAFGGTFSHEMDDGLLRLGWQSGTERAVLLADLTTAGFTIEFTRNGEVHSATRATDL